MKKGFTLLEVLVASMLLGMLVSILTMVFNQSSVAWRTGIAGVADLDERRQEIARKHSMADAALPNVHGNDKCYITSPWEIDGSVRSRAVKKGDDAGIDFNDPSDWVAKSITGGSTASAEMRSYIVGVTSAGPDGIFFTYDDITTMPKEAK